MLNPFHDSSNISIRLVQKDGKEENDDRIVIVYKGEDTYHVYYKDGYNRNGMTHCVVLTGAELDTYLESLIDLLNLDSDPFRSIQLNIPCMPSIMLSMKSLKEEGLKTLLANILPLLSSCLKINIDE